MLNNPVYFEALRLRVENRHTVSYKRRDPSRLEIPKLTSNVDNSAARAQMNYYIFLTRGILRRTISVKPE